MFALPFLLVALYSLGAQWLMLHLPHSLLTVCFVLGPVVLGAALALRAAGHRAAVALLAVGAVAWLVWLGTQGPHDMAWLYVTEYVGIYGFMAIWFWHSLRSTPLITRVARTVHALTPAMECYTVKLTRAWALYFAGMALLSVALFVWLPFGGWALYANIGSPLALGAFFVGEHVLRYRWHPEFDRASIWASARAWRARAQETEAALNPPEIQPPGSAR
ncbi:MAG: hypothetical protein ACK5NW_03825 [Ottowia sp.]